MKKICMLTLRFLLLLCVLLLMQGCGHPREPLPEDLTETGAAYAPALADIPGVPFSADIHSAARTSQCRMAEVENGYYAQFWGTLYYADKTDLTTWAAVCNRPDCSHSDGACPAQVSETFCISGGRIYSCRSTYDPSWNTDAGVSICSSALDGTDLSIAEPISDFPARTGGVYSSAFTPDGFCLSYCTLLETGEYETCLLRMTEDGQQVLSGGKSADTVPVEILPASVQGDCAVYSSLLSDSGLFDHLYRITGEEAEEIPGICRYDLTGAYLNQLDLYRFVPNDGYYYTDLRTGASAKWMDAQLQDSAAYHYGTDFILETNLTEGPITDTPAIRLFDGEKWAEIGLPEDFWPEANAGLEFFAVTTSHLFLKVNSLDPRVLTSTLYAIDRTADRLEAVRCAEFGS